MELVEEVNKIVGIKSNESLSPGQVMKAMILNGLWFLSAPLYLFEEFLDSGNVDNKSVFVERIKEFKKQWGSAECGLQPNLRLLPVLQLVILFIFHS